MLPDLDVCRACFRLHQVDHFDRVAQHERLAQLICAHRDRSGVSACLCFFRHIDLDPGKLHIIGCDVLRSALVDHVREFLHRRAGVTATDVGIDLLEPLDVEVIRGQHCTLFVGEIRSSDLYVGDVTSHRGNDDLGVELIASPCGAFICRIVSDCQLVIIFCDVEQLFIADIRVHDSQ